MRIGIITFQYVSNYGAVLQAYALKKCLESMGHEVDVLDYRPDDKSMMWDAKEYLRRKIKAVRYVKNRSFLKNVLLIVYNVFLLCSFRFFKYPLMKSKYKKFDSFVYKFLCKRNQIFTIDSSEKYLGAYNVLFYGSDQIWNPQITGGFDELYFAGKTKKNQKKVAYAASIGDLTILTNDKEVSNIFFSKISSFDFLSVREKNLSEYILTHDFKVCTVVDPTFLISRDEYSPILDCCPCLQTRPYILVYHLLYDEKMNALANAIANLKGWEVIIVNGTFSGGKNVQKDLGPCEFLGLLNGAQLVLTNSFHGVTLSIVFKKSFFVRLPKYRQDRLFSLLESLGLSNRILEFDKMNACFCLDSMSLDYSALEPVIEEYRFSSYKYIINALA